MHFCAGSVLISDGKKCNLSPSIAFYSPNNCPAQKMHFLCRKCFHLVFLIKFSNVFLNFIMVFSLEMNRERKFNTIDLMMHGRTAISIDGTTFQGGADVDIEEIKIDTTSLSFGAT